MGMVRYPLPITPAMVTPANENAAKPRAIPADYVGGVRGDDTDTATANVAVARQGGGANEPDYTPRTQAAKATQLGTTLAADVSRRRGYIGPQDPYPTGGAVVPPAPVVSSISPTTAPAASLPLMVTITGTGFSVWSLVYTGGATVHDGSAVYVSPTQMKVPIWAAAPGTVSVAVRDHGLMSNADKLFTVT